MAGQRVRVIRTVVYEGTEEWLSKQLARSSPLGTRTLPDNCTIHITQGPIAVVDPQPKETETHG